MLAAGNLSRKLVVVVCSGGNEGNQSCADCDQNWLFLGHWTAACCQHAVSMYLGCSHNSLRDGPGLKLSMSPAGDDSSIVRKKRLCFDSAMLEVDASALHGYIQWVGSWADRDTREALICKYGAPVPTCWLKIALISPIFWPEACTSTATPSPASGSVLPDRWPAASKNAHFFLGL